MEVLALHLHNYIAYAGVRGVSVSEILQSIPDFPSDPVDEITRIDSETFYRVLACLHAKTGDELWGIKAGDFMALKLLGLIYRISLKATTVAEAFHYLQSYLSATLPIINTQTDVTNDAAVVTLHIENNEEQLNRVILENTLTIITREIRMMAGDDLIISLETPFYTTAYPDGWKKGDAFKLSFQPRILKAALRDRTPLHLDTLIPQYLKLIEQLKGGDRFSNRVKITMLSMSDPQLPNIQQLANALHVTPRTLQRRLEAEGTTYRMQLEELKKQVCSYLLRHDCYSATTVSYILGYSEPASFLHSFKKWYGDSPERIRQRLKNNMQEVD